MAANITLDTFFSPLLRARIGKIILYIAIISFLVHLGLYFTNTYLLTIDPNRLLASPINAIYTPFSFLLVYEAYLLLYYLPQSTTIYIGKQYEIITLILIRGIFKDITHLDLTNTISGEHFHNELWFDLGTVFLVFGLIFIFYKINRYFSKQSVVQEPQISKASTMQRFITAKKYLSVVLLFISIFLAAYSFIEWMMDTSATHDLQSAIDINSIFFDHFFSLLIISDVIILLISLLYTDDYPLIIRNSSFVISTILLKLSFSATGIMEQVFILIGVAFGIAMYALSNLFHKA